MNSFSLNDFDFHLPEQLIAQLPAANRDSSRLLVINGPELQDKTFSEIVEFFEPGDLIIFNDTKVIPSALTAFRNSPNGGLHSHKMNLLKRIDDFTWSTLIKNSRRIKCGDQLFFSEELHAKVIDKCVDGRVVLQFNRGGGEFYSTLEMVGNMPLPPYINQGVARNIDKERYQTTYAQKAGAVAAPTAGLHFTEEIIEQIKARGAKVAFITLHVGGGTFLPVKCENIDEHVMHSEELEITEETVQMIKSAKRVFAVGTTSLRALEGVYAKLGRLESYIGETDIFIKPGFEFKVVDALITNFHLPKSTLMMLVSAFAGIETIRNAYTHAVNKKYRFFSYGDSSLMFRK